MAFDFPASPAIGQVYLNYTWDGEKWQATGGGQGAVRYDIAQGLTPTQQATGRANIGVMKKNYIINGAMQVSQEWGSAAQTVNLRYPVDMFYQNYGHGGTQAAAQIADLTPAGSPNRLRIEVGTADASVAAGDYSLIVTAIEGTRAADLKAGTAGAKTITVQFGVRAPAGTYCLAVNGNVGGGRAYVSEYVISAGEANTDVVKSVTVSLYNSGTPWPVDNQTAIGVYWVLMCGTSFQAAANSWVTGNVFASANQFNFMGTAGNRFELFDVSLTEGTVAPPFQVPDYPSELALCQRYWEKVPFTITASPYTYDNSVGYKMQKRAAPTLTFSGSLFGATIANMADPTWGVQQTVAATTASGTIIYANARF
jgi:hypothetical protein